MVVFGERAERTISIAVASYVLRVAVRVGQPAFGTNLEVDSVLLAVKRLFHP